MIAERSREDWKAELKQICIDHGIEPQLAKIFADKYLSKIEGCEHKIIYGNSNGEEPIGLIHDMKG